MAVTLAVVGKFTDKDLKKAEAQLAKLKREALLAASPVARLGVTFEKTGDKMKKVGGTMTKYLTVPIGGLAAAAGASFMAVDEGLDTVAARSGETGAKLTELQTTFKNVAKTATQDMTTVGEVVGGLAGKLGLTGKPLEQLSTEILNLARVTGTDATAATDAVAKAVNGLGISGKDTGKFLDDLLVASQKSGISVDQLATTLAATGPAFRTMGIDTTDATALIAAFERAGLPTTRMVAGLTAATANFAKKGIKDIPGALEKTIAQIKNAGTESEATAIAVKTFGSRAGVALGGAIRSGALNVEDLTKALKDSNGALDRTVKATDGPEENFQRLKNQAMLAGSSLAEAFLPAVERIVPVITKMANAFGALSPGVKTAIVVAGGFVAALGPMLSIAGNVTTVVGKLMQSQKLAAAATKIWTGIQAAFNAVMAANPIVLATIAVAALVAGVVIAYKRFEGFRNVVDAIGHAIKTGVVAAFNVAKQAVGVAVQLIAGYLNLWKTAALAVVNTVVGAFNALKTAVGAVVGFARDVISNVVDFYMSIPSKLAALPKAMLNIGKDLVRGIWEGMLSMGSYLTDKIKDWASGIVNGIKGFFGISSPSKVMADVGADVARGMAVGMESHQTTILKAGKKLAKTAVEAARGALDGIKDQAREVLDFARGVASDVGSFGKVTGIDTSEGSVTGSSVIASMASRLATVRNFGKQLKDLAALGLNNASLQDIIAAGPEAGSQIAAALLKDGKSAIDEVNSLESQLGAASRDIGVTAADSAFGPNAVANARATVGTQINVSQGAIVLTVGAGADRATAAEIERVVNSAVQRALLEAARQARASK